MQNMVDTYEGRLSLTEAQTNSNTASILVQKITLETLSDSMATLLRDGQALQTRQQKLEEKWGRIGAPEPAMVPAPGDGQGRRLVDPLMEATLLISGIKQIRESYQMSPSTDPCRVVAKLLEEVACLCSMDRMFLADKKAGNDRSQANAVAITMRTPYHKREALIKIKKALRQHNVERVVVRDCYPQNQMEEAKRLTTVGLAMKRRGEIANFLVINLGGKPYLQAREEQGGRLFPVDNAVTQQTEQQLRPTEADTEADPNYFSPEVTPEVTPEVQITGEVQTRQQSSSSHNISSRGAAGAARGGVAARGNGQSLLSSNQGAESCPV
jgi:hypothetical protein